MTATWSRNVTEVVWQSATAPGVTWTTIVGGTSSSVPSDRLLPAEVGDDGQVLTVVDGERAWADPSGGDVPAARLVPTPIVAGKYLAGNDDGTATEFVDPPEGGAGVPSSYPVVVAASSTSVVATHGSVVVGAMNLTPGFQVLADYASGSPEVWTSDGTDLVDPVSLADIEQAGRIIGANFQVALSDGGAFSFGQVGGYLRQLTTNNGVTYTLEEPIAIPEPPEVDPNQIIADSNLIRPTVIFSRINNGCYSHMDWSVLAEPVNFLDPVTKVPALDIYDAAYITEHGIIEHGDLSWPSATNTPIIDGFPWQGGTIYLDLQADPALNGPWDLDPTNPGTGPATRPELLNGWVGASKWAEGTVMWVGSGLRMGRTYWAPGYSGTFTPAEQEFVQPIQQSIFHLAGASWVAGDYVPSEGDVLVFDPTEARGFGWATPTGGGGIEGPESSIDGRPAVWVGEDGSEIGVGSVNAPNGLARLNGDGVLPDTVIDSTIVRESEMATAIDQLAGAVSDALAGLQPPILVTETTASAVTMTTTPAQVCSITLPTLAVGYVVEFEAVHLITNSGTSPRGYAATLRMNGNTIASFSSPQNVPNGAPRHDHLKATILVTGSPGQSIVGTLVRNTVPVGPVVATAAESQTTPTLEVWMATNGNEAGQTVAQVMVVAKVFRPAS